MSRVSKAASGLPPQSQRAIAHLGKGISIARRRRKLPQRRMADVLTTTVIGLRHLSTHGAIAIHPQRSLLVLAEAAAKAMHSSQFVRNTFAPWTRGQVAGARLKGTVYRAA